MKVESTPKIILPVSCLSLCPSSFIPHPWSFIVRPSIFVMNEFGKRNGNVTELVVQRAVVPHQPGRVVSFAEILKFAC